MISSATQPVSNATNSTALPPSSNQQATLDQSDFLRLLTTQLQQQDPLEPTDNKEMIAQMAQFSSLANTAQTNATLSEIVQRLDDLIAVQAAPASPAQS